MALTAAKRQKRIRDKRRQQNMVTVRLPLRKTLHLRLKRQARKSGKSLMRYITEDKLGGRG